MLNDVGASGQSIVTKKSGGKIVTGPVVCMPPIPYSNIVMSSHLTNVNDSKQPFSEPLDHWLMHIWNRISCLNIDESEVETFDDGDICSIEKLVLSKSVLTAFVFRKRKSFYLA